MHELHRFVDYFDWNKQIISPPQQIKYKEHMGWVETLLSSHFDFSETLPYVCYKINPALKWKLRLFWEGQK